MDAKFEALVRMALGGRQGEADTAAVAIFRSLRGRGIQPHQLAEIFGGTNLRNLVLRFRPYNGKSIGWVWERDPQYVQWLADNSTLYWVKRAAQEIVRENGREVTSSSAGRTPRPCSRTPNRVRRPTL